MKIGPRGCRSRPGRRGGISTPFWMRQKLRSDPTDKVRGGCSASLCFQLSGHSPLTAFTARRALVHLASLARSEAPAAELNAYVEIMMPCVIGLGHRTSVAPSIGGKETSRRVTCLIMRVWSRPGKLT
jgi:hypothetical protein